MCRSWPRATTRTTCPSSGTLLHTLSALSVGAPSSKFVCSEGKISDTLCYPITKQIGTFLDRPDVRRTLGVDASLTANFSSCNHDVGAAFSQAMDRVFPTQFYIAALLERGIKTLIYVGANDWICNWVGISTFSARSEQC